MSLVIYTKTPYEVRVIKSIPMFTGDTGYLCYSVYNTLTGVTEAYIGQLAKAKQVCNQYALELKRDA